MKKCTKMTRNDEKVHKNDKNDNKKVMQKVTIFTPK